MSSSSLTCWLESGCGWREGSEKQEKMTQQGGLIEIPDQELAPEVCSSSGGRCTGRLFPMVKTVWGVFNTALLLVGKPCCSSWGKGDLALGACGRMEGWRDEEMDRQKDGGMKEQMDRGRMEKCRGNIPLLSNHIITGHPHPRVSCATDFPSHLL